MRPAKRLAAGLCLIAATSLLAATSFSADSVPICSGNLFDQDCKDRSSDPLDLRKSTSEADGVLFNYFLLTKPEAASMIGAFNTMPGKELQNKAVKVAEEARAAAIHYVTGEVAEEKWSPEMRIAVQRLRLLKFRLSEPTSSDCLATGDPGIPNAQYRFHEHTIGICPASLKIPTAQLAATLAHEIGHSVSPCMLSKPLVKYKGANREYGVDVAPDNTEFLIGTGEAERVSNSDLENPPAYRTFNACLDALYKIDYEDWLSLSALGIEKISGTLSPRFSKMLADARKRTPQRCYEKAEEHFADSFGSFVYDGWALKRELSARDTRNGLHDLIVTKCAHDLNPAHAAFKTNHASDSTRLSLFLKPKGTAARLGCSASAQSLCALTETSFASDHAPAATGSGTKQ